MKIKTLTLIIFLLIAFNINGQIKITGQIHSNENIPVPFAEIILVSKDSIPLKSELSDENGMFTIESERESFILQIRQIGDILYNKEFQMSSNSNIGIIKINTTKSLQEVVVTLDKKLIERKVDRLVFNVENSISASGGDGLEALKITPGLRVNNDQISMIGKSSMNVMINDRLINLSGEDLTSFLKNLKSDEIKKIEVITSPPAKYDAQGNSGLINIVTKKVKNNTFNGNLNSSLSQSKTSIGSGGLNLNYRKNNLTLTSDVNYSNGSMKPYQEYTIKYPNYIWEEESFRKSFSNSLSTRSTIDYKISSKTRIGGEYSFSNSLPLIKTKNNSFIYNNSKMLDSLIKNESRIEIKRKTNTYNAYYITHLDTLGRKINFDIDYVNYESETNNDFYSNSFFPNGTIKPNNYFAANNFSDLKIDIVTTRLDFDYPTKWINLNFGTKLTFIENNSEVQFYNTTSGTSVEDPLQSNTFNYKERIQALYFSGTKNLTEKLDIQFGLRAENTQTKGTSQTLSQVNKNDYFKLFPTLYLNYMINDYKIISLNYNKRINRPSYNNLNPFRFYSTSFNYSEGNPFLQPYMTNNFELAYIYKKSYSLLYISHIKNGFDQVTYTDPNSIIQRVTPNNFYNQINYGFLEAYSFKVKSYWENNSDISIFYYKTDSDIDSIIPDISNWSGSFNTNNTFILDEEKKYKLSLGFMYNLPSIAGSYKLSSFYRLNLGFKTNFLNKNLQLSINVIDILKTDKQTFTQYVNNIKQVNLDYRDVRRIRISLVYSFGKELKIKNRVGSNKEEKQRIK